MKKNISADFKSLLTKEYISNMAECHREAWQDRMKSQTKAQVKFDLDMNHDDSLEIERAEEDLKRELTDDERKQLINKFHSEVVKQHHKTDYSTD